MSFRKALFYSFTTRYFAIGLQFFATIILARLLTPAEIGIYSVGAAVVMIAQTLRDFGTSSYVIQEQELSPGRLGTAFSLTVIVAWTIAACLWLGAAELAVFYREEGVRSVMRVMAINFALIPFGSITMALLRREMNFRTLMFITLASTVVHSGSAVSLALSGFGYMSLAWASVCGTLATVVGAFVASPSSFLHRPTLAEHARVLAFTMRSSVSSIASESGHFAPDLVLGRTIGMEGTGFFSRATGYVQILDRLLQDVLRSVMLPYLAEEVRAGEGVRRKLALAQDSIVSISFFILALTGVLASPMIRILYGEQWGDAVPLAQVLCVAMAAKCVAPTLSAALIADGKIAYLMRSTLMSTAAKFFLLIVFSVHGLLYAAIGFVFSELLAVLSILYFSNRARLFLWSDYASAVVRNLPIALAGASPAIFAMLWAPPSNSIAGSMLFLVAAGTASVIAWFVILWVLDRPQKHELLRVLAAIKSRL